MPRRKLRLRLCFCNGMIWCDKWPFISIIMVGQKPKSQTLCILRAWYAEFSISWCIEVPIPAIKLWYTLYQRCIASPMHQDIEMCIVSQFGCNTNTLVRCTWFLEFWYDTQHICKLYCIQIFNQSIPFLLLTLAIHLPWLSSTTVKTLEILNRKAYQPSSFDPPVLGIFSERWDN